MTQDQARDKRCVVLGSGGWMPTPERGTSCLLVRDGGDALLLDAGTGVVSVCRDVGLLGGVSHVDVVLSHFHLDHVAGLTYLPSLGAQVDMTVWAPGQLLLETDSLGVLSTLVGTPFLSVDLGEVAEVRELVTGTNRISSWAIDARVQPFHPGGSIGFRLGDTLAYCTDTAPDPDCAAFVRGVDVLVHEAWTPSAASGEHSSAASAAETAAAAGVNRLVLSHVNPLHDDPAALLGAAAPIFSNTEVSRDGQVLY